MDGNVDVLEGLVMHKEAISEQFSKTTYYHLYKHSVRWVEKVN